MEKIIRVDEDRAASEGGGKVKGLTGRVYTPVTCVVILFVLTALPGMADVNSDEKVIPGITLRGISLGDKNRGEVEAVCDLIQKEIDAHIIVLDILEEGKKIPATYQEMGVSIDRERVWREAVSQGRQGKWWENLWVRWKIKNRGREVRLFLQLDEKRAEKTICQAAGSWEKEPQDARFLVSGKDEVSILPERYGKKVEIDRALVELKQRFEEDGEEVSELLITFQTVTPQRLKKNIEEQGPMGLLCAFTTTFNPQKEGRTGNIQLAAGTLDHVVLAPGQIFSFNDTVGPRTAERGYSEADIIFNNELIPGVGGGVCQVSTTLYNAVLRAELEIIARSPHSMLIAYVEPGLDATVAYGSIDFRFRNNTKGYILIKSQVDRQNLTVKIFGLTRTEGRKVVIKSVIEKEIPPQTVLRDDPLVAEGNYILEREGKPGYVVRVERMLYDTRGLLVKKEVISRDTYPPVDRIIKTSTS